MLKDRHRLQYSRIMPHLTTLSSKPLQARFVDSIAEVSAKTWNRLVDNASPFLRHEFLLALEASASTTAETGWQPCHLLLCMDGGDGAENVVAAVPLFQKTHSYGEYVFDWSWADAYHRHGISYYPKLISAVPFTPSVASRILMGDIHYEKTAASQNRLEEITHAVATAIKHYAKEKGQSSWHVLFPDSQQSQLLASQGLLQRSACQFHWRNRGYQNFEDFLQTFSSRKRKNLRKEREAVRQQGVQFEYLLPENIDERLWDQFYLFYQSTYLIRGQQGYLSREFFSLVAASMPENLLLVMAKQNGRYIAGALSFKDDKKLYGRYWGCLQEFQFLHFEACYYQGINYCIENGLESFDSGAQGEHKIQRGFEPVKTFSNHWIADERFADAIADFLRREAKHIDAYIEQTKAFLPFKRNDN